MNEEEKQALLEAIRRWLLQKQQQHQKTSVEGDVK